MNRLPGRAITEKTSRSANLGLEEKLRAVPDKMCGDMDTAEYKYVLLGLYLPKSLRGELELFLMETIRENAAA